MEQWGRSANAIERDFSNTASLQWNTTVSAATLNEVRFQFSREDRPRDYAGPSLPGQNRPLPDTGIDFAGQYRFGLRFFIPVKDHDTRFQVNDNVSVIRGAHNFKFGAELNRTSTTRTFVGFANGRYPVRAGRLCGVLGRTGTLLELVRYGAGTHGAVAPPATHQACHGEARADESGVVSSCARLFLARIAPCMPPGGGAAGNDCPCRD